MAPPSSAPKQGEQATNGSDPARTSDRTYLHNTENVGDSKLYCKTSQVQRALTPGVTNARTMSKHG
eukprot:5237812-Pyramimonas_sp.AAC.1